MKSSPLILIAATLVSPALSAPSSESIHDVGARKQLFLDHRFIAASENVRLTVNPPEKLQAPALAPDKPWEAFRFTCLSVLQDPEDGIYKMWYAAFDLPQWVGTGIGGETPGKATVAYVCYATSRDGLKWVKPDLGLVEYHGSRNNNIIIAGNFYMKMFSVFRDPHGKREERYKMIYEANPQNTEVKKAGVSSDGLHWRFPGTGGLAMRTDTQHIAFWDDRIDKYVLFIKTPADKDGKGAAPFVDPIASVPAVVAPKILRPSRAVGRMEIDDLLQDWPRERLRMVLAADEMDPEDSDIYSHNPYQYPYADDAYFLFPMVYQHFRPGESPVNNDGVTDIQFAASRDGVHFMRYDRQSYIRRGLPGEPDAGLVWPSNGVVRSGNYLLQYYTNWPWTHGGFRTLPEADQINPKISFGKVCYYIARQRLDGFVSADASHASGWLQTPPLRFAGDHLELNVNPSATGEVRAEIQDEAGHPIAGFSRTDCDRLLFNDVAARVSWKHASSLAALKGRTIRLQIEMRSAKLYAFQFCGTETAR